MSTREEVVKAIEETGGPVWCFVSDSEDFTKDTGGIIRKVCFTKATGFETSGGFYYKYAKLISELMLVMLQEQGVISKQDSPLIKALKEGRSVVCWVSDNINNPGKGSPVKLIEAYCEEDDSPFKSICSWKYATPVSSDYIL